MLANIVGKKLTLQQRRHLDLTGMLARVAVQRDEAIMKLVKLDTKLRDLQRKIGRSGKRLRETREALSENVGTLAVAPPLARAAKKSKRLPVEGDCIADLLSERRT